MGRLGDVAAASSALVFILLTTTYAVADCAISIVSPAQGAHIAVPQEFTWQSSSECSNQAIVFTSSWSMTASSVIFPEVKSPFVLSQEYWEEIVETLGQAEVYRWAVGTFEGGIWTHQSQARTFVVGQVCSAVLNAPAAEQVVGLPATFSWTNNGACVFETVAIARVRSDDPSTWWLAKSSSSLTLARQDWDEVVAQLGASETYYWTVVEDLHGWHIRVAAWQPFKIGTPTDRSDGGDLVPSDPPSNQVPPPEDESQGYVEDSPASPPALCGAGLLESALLCVCAMLLSAGGRVGRLPRTPSR